MIKYFLLLFFLPLYNYSQTPLLKLKKTIITDYYFKIYLEGEIRSDTFIVEYNPDQSPKQKSLYPIPVINISRRDSTKVLEKNKTCIHKREYWSDSTFKDIISSISKHTLTRVTLQNGDTTKIQTAFFRGFPILKFKFENYESIVEQVFQPYKLNLEFKKNNGFQRKVMIDYSYKNGCNDSLKIIKYPFNKNYKKLVFNKNKKEWFVEEKVVFRNRKKITWKTFFHEDHEKYFTSKTVFVFNKYRHLISKKEYDGLHFLVKETKYTYEYY